MVGEITARAVSNGWRGIFASGDAHSSTVVVVRNILLLLRRKQIRGKRYVSSALRVLADESRGRDSAVTQTSDVR